MASRIVRAGVLFCFLLGLTLAPPVAAQTVHWEKYPTWRISREGDRAAKEQRRADWVDLKSGESGTRVVLTADLRNADATLITNRSFGAQRLATESVAIATCLALPETSVIMREGRKVIAADLEFNGYIRQGGRRSSFFTLNLAGLRDALQASALPRPITIFVSEDPGQVTVATLSAPERRDRPVGDAFFALSNIPDGAAIRYRSHIPWYGYLGVCFLLGPLLVIPLSEWWGYHGRRKARRKLRGGVPAANFVPDPATVQEQYNKQKPFWLLSLILPGAAIALLLSGWFFKGLYAALATIQFSGVPIPVISMPALLFLGITRFVITQIEKAEVKREGSDAVPIPFPQDAEDSVPNWTRVGFLYPMTGMAVVLLVISGFMGSIMGHLNRLSPNAAWYAYAAFITVGVTATVLIAVCARRVTHHALPPDHFAASLVQQMVRDAGVRVRKIEVVRTREVNAYVNLWGTMGFTTRLLREFSPDELRVVIAHEIGHFRAADPRRNLLISLLLTSALVAAGFFGRIWIESHYKLSHDQRVLLNTPFFAIFVMPLLTTLLVGRGRRRAEELADRFAVDSTGGDGEFVIATLTKLHTLNAMPHQLKPSDELLSSHPSLANRVAAIRRYMGEKG